MFVMTDALNAKNIKITPKTVKIWSTVITVNNSTMNFILPLQNTTQREITDYTNPNLLSPAQ
jgi:hypothetical protein